MWDTRSIIVRFRRQRGNTCLPGELTKANSKKSKEAENVTLITNVELGDKKDHMTSLKNETKLPGNISSTNVSSITESSTAVTSSVTTLKNDQDLQTQSRVKIF